MLLAFALAGWGAAPAAEAAFGPLGDDFRLSFMGPAGDKTYTVGPPSTAYNPTANEYLVVWSGVGRPTFIAAEIEIFAQRVSASGAPVGQPIRVSEMGPDTSFDYRAVDPSVAYNSEDDQYLVTWSGDDDTGSLGDDELEIFGQRLTAAGVQTGANDFRLSDMGPDGDTAYRADDPSVVYNRAASEYLVTWSGDDDTGSLVDGELEIFGQRLTAAGAPAGLNDFRVSDMGADGFTDYGAFEPSVANSAADNEYLVTWSGDDIAGALADEEFEIFGQRLTAAGAGTGANDFRISDLGPDGDADYEAFGQRVVYNSADDEYLVTWVGDDDTAPLVDNEYEVFGQRLSAAGAEAGANDFRISGMGPDGSIQYGAVDLSLAYSSARDEYLVTWSGEDDSAPLADEEFEIFGQRLTATGAEVGTADFRISDMGPDGDTAYGAGVPSVAYNSADDQFLVTWKSDDDTAPLVDDEFEIFGRRLGDTPSPGGVGTPGGGTAGGGTAGGAGPAAFGARTLVTLRLAARRIPASGPLAVRVANANGFEITGRLSGRTANPVGARRRHIGLKAKAFTIGATAKKTVRLRLPRPLRRLLRSHRKLKLRLTAQVKDPAGNSRSAKQKVTPRLKTKRRN
jgi:hypothetical protein